MKKLNQMVVGSFVLVFLYSCQGNQSAQDQNSSSEVNTENNTVGATSDSNVQEEESTMKTDVSSGLENTSENAEIRELDKDKTGTEQPSSKVEKEGAKTVIPNSEKVQEVELIEETVIEEPAVSIHDHMELNALLNKYVTAAGKVNYKGMKTEHQRLKNYLNELATNEPTSDWDRTKKLAYWINLYNASTLDLILDHYPIASITDLNKPWDQKNIKSGNRTLSLNQIENEIIRPLFNEPRIHFAVNCAAISCPKLLNEAFVWSKLHTQMEKATIYFVNNGTKNSIQAGSVSISKIFEWYTADFGGQEGLIAFLNKYSTTKINNDASITYQEYNWKLNE